jgi:hypothetical protein
MLATLALGLSTLAGVAAAEEPTRVEYVSRLEAICEPGSKATQKAMEGVRDDVRKGRDTVAAQKFDQVRGSSAKPSARSPRSRARVPTPAASRPGSST